MGTMWYQIQTNNKVRILILATTIHPNHLPDRRHTKRSTDTRRPRARVPLLSWAPKQGEAWPGNSSSSVSALRERLHGCSTFTEFRQSRHSILLVVCVAFLPGFYLLTGVGVTAASPRSVPLCLCTYINTGTNVKGVVGKPFVCFFDFHGVYVHTTTKFR